MVAELLQLITEVRDLNRQAISIFKPLQQSSSPPHTLVQATGVAAQAVCKATNTVPTDLEMRARVSVTCIFTGDPAALISVSSSDDVDQLVDELDHHECLSINGPVADIDNDAVLDSVYNHDVLAGEPSFTEELFVVIEPSPDACALFDHGTSDLAISAPTATTPDANSNSNCSTKFLNHANSVTSPRFGLTLEQPIVTQQKSDGKGFQLGLRLLVLALTPSQVKSQSVVYYSLETVEIWFECRLWDPGLAEFRELSITRWYIHSLAAFPWDPGLAMGVPCSDTCRIAGKWVHSLATASIISILQIVSSIVDQLQAVSIDIFSVLEPGRIACELTVCYIVFSDSVLDPPQVPDSDGHCLEPVSVQWHLPFASFSKFPLDFIGFKISTEAVRWCSSTVMLIWMSIGELMFSACVLPLLQARCFATCHVKISILGQHTKHYEMECVVSLLFAAGIACYVLACGGFYLQLAATDIDILILGSYQLPSVDILPSTVEVYSSVDSQLEPLSVAKVNVAIRTDNSDSAVMYDSHAVALQRLLSVMQWVLVTLSQGCSIMSASAILGFLPSSPGTNVLQMSQRDQLQSVNCCCLQMWPCSRGTTTYLPGSLSIRFWLQCSCIHTGHSCLSAIPTEFQGVFSQLAAKKLTQVPYFTEEDMVIGASGT